MQKCKRWPKKAIKKNTVKTTKTWMNVWKSWAESKGFNDDILKYEAKELDECLSRFFAEIRKSDGSDYEPDSLRVMLAALDRHLKQNDSKISIAKDREFVKCRQVLEGKARALREKGRKRTLCTWRTKFSHSRFMLVFEVAKRTMKCVSKISA